MMHPGVIEIVIAVLTAIAIVLFSRWLIRRNERIVKEDAKPSDR